MGGARSADRPPPIPHAFRLFILFLLVRIGDAATASFDLEKALSTPCNPSCYNGACFSEQCVCQKGWRGQQCDLCHGRVEIHDLTTPISDSPVNYASTANCGWVVDVANSTNLKLTVSNFSTECGWDYLYVYDGEGTDGEQLAALCGQINEPFEINLPSAKSFAFFFSDLAQNHDGFTVSVEHNSCPYNCSGVGRCLPSGECSDCPPGHTGRYCEQQFCADELDGEVGPCFNASKCKKGANGEQASCDCNQPHHGDQCQELKSKSLWERDVVRSGPQPRGRASHASVLITRNGVKEIWTIFGDRFNNVPNFGEIVVYDTEKKTWNEITTNGNRPEWRYDHSLVYYKSKIYLFGGMINRQHTSAELWSLDLTSLVWSKEHDDNKDLITGPLAVYGHSAHVIDNKMYVFFGFNPVIRFVTRVQIWDFESRQWSSADVTDIDAGRYRHTSVYYEPQHAVLVYGGILQQPATGDASTNGNVTTDKLIRFTIPRDGSGYNWESLESSGTPMYMHSAAIINGIMITAGGNAYMKNGQPTDCFQGIVLNYDILCNKWTPPLTSPLLRRYGHSMVTDGEDYAWVVGGFNGTMLNDVIRFIPADCVAGTKNLNECAQITEGVQCVFTNGKCTKYSTSESFPADFLSVISGLPAKKSIQRAEPKCQNTADDRSSACEDNSDCLSCASHSGCGWCVGSSQCLSVEQECVAGQDMIRSYTSCQSDLAVREQHRSCSSVSDCFSCKLMTHCNWFGYEGKKSCVSLREQGRRVGQDGMRAQVASEMAAREAERLASSKVPVRLTTSLASFPSGLPSGQNFTLCPTPCPEYTNCTQCVENKCMWCGSQKRCVYTDSYLISFPYGQCYQWTTNIDNTYCEIESGQCSEHKNCSMCQLDPNCGWWDDGGNTGQGACLEGNNAGPRDPAPSDRGTWHFVGCPLCQCNGHSECRKSLESGIEVQKCMECGNNTTGNHCETCAEGYYGDTRNGGICKPCECVGNADGCDPHSGECYCTTKGVVGKLCDRCDTKYIGNPENGRPCYYELTVDFIFTFKLKNEPPDDHVSEIYLFSVPYKRDTDVQFSISCESATAAVSLNLTSNIFDGRSSNPKMKMSASNYFVDSDENTLTFEDIINHPCDAKGLRRHYLANDPGYAFGTDANTTFFVKVSNFSTPITIQISFAQSPPINWVLFFVIFAACFIILLVVAGLLWMVKLRIEAYRARQNHINELVHTPPPPLYPLLGVGADRRLILDRPMPPTPTNSPLLDHDYCLPAPSPPSDLPDEVRVVPTFGAGQMPPTLHPAPPASGARIEYEVQQDGGVRVYTREHSPPLTRRPPLYTALHELQFDGLWHTTHECPPPYSFPAPAPQACGRARLGSEAEEAGRVFHEGRPFEWGGDWMEKLVVTVAVLTHGCWLLKRNTRFAKRKAARAWRTVTRHGRILPEDYLDPTLEEDADFLFLLTEEEMNSRPSRSIKLDLSAPGSNLAPTPIAIEPRANYKVGLVTVAMRLPTGGKPYTPNGTSGLALGSALCLLTPAQEQHLRSSDDGETRPKRNDKFSRFFPWMGRGSPQ